METITAEPTVSYIINQQVLARPIVSESGQLWEELNALFVELGDTEKVVAPTPEGEAVLSERVYVLRNGENIGRTRNGNVELKPGDQVVYNREHSNG